MKRQDIGEIRRLYKDLQETDPIIVQKLGLSQVRKDLGGNEPIIQELGLDKSIGYQPGLLVDDDVKPTKCKELQEQKDLLDRLLWCVIREVCLVQKIEQTTINAGDKGSIWSPQRRANHGFKWQDRRGREPVLLSRTV